MGREEGGGASTANEEGPHRSEDGGIIVPQSRESLGKPSIWSTIIVDVPSGYKELALKS